MVRGGLGGHSGPETQKPMSKHKLQRKRAAQPRNQTALILIFIAVALLLLILRLFVFVHHVNAHHPYAR
jgi:hypothetical protein